MSRLLEQINHANVATIPTYSACEKANESTSTTTTTTATATPTGTAPASTTETILPAISSKTRVQTTSHNNNREVTADKTPGQPKPRDATHVQTVLISLCSGAAAGALAKTTIAPLDRAKIYFQIQKDIPYTFKSAIEFIKKTYHEKGTLALWRGNSATMARIIPYAAIHFTAHEQWRKLLQVDKDGADTKLRRFIAGSLAGVTGQSLTYPLDLARARMAVTDRQEYGTLRSVFVHIWRDEGPRALFRGYIPTIMGVVPYAGTSFFTYESLKREYAIITGEPKAPTLIALAFGAVAGAMGQTASYPLDIVRRRMQTMKLEKGSNYPSTLTLLVKIYKEEGIRGGFYKGVSMNWIKGPIAVGISFSTYDFVQDSVRKIFNLKPSRQVNNSKE